MKAYIIYIATLLAALTQPAISQTSPQTKAAPDFPAMPYKLTGNTIGGNNGTVDISISTSNGATFATIDKDSIVYGASSGANVSTVKIATTLKKGYSLRADFPKVYKTGDVNKTTVGSPSNIVDKDAAKVRTFTMPAHPVTVEMAYSENVEIVAAITLKEDVTGENVVSKLPGYIHITLSSGRKDSLVATNWVFSKRGATDIKTKTGTETFDATDGAINRFTCTTTLPDSITDTGNKLTSILVANMANALKPTGTDLDLIIYDGIGDNLNVSTDNGTTKKPFNGTIEEGTVKSIVVSSDVKDATLTLKGVTVTKDASNGGTTIIKGDADLTLKIEGNSNVGALTVENDATIVLNKTADAKLEGTIENNGTFRDSTATVTKVEGIGALQINATLAGGGSVTINTPVTLTATTNDAAGTTTFIWQKQLANGSYIDVQKKAYNENGTPVASLKDEYKPSTAAIGTTLYRCLIERTIPTAGANKDATTLLSTQPTRVEVKADGGTPDPDPTPPPVAPTHYTVTLPTLVGFTTNPAAGAHSVEEGYNFTFSLTLANGYTGSAPIVTTSRGETLSPRQSDGKYVISGVDRNITIYFTSIPTANEAIEAESLRIWNTAGGLNIHTPQAATTTIYTLSGHCIKQFDAPAGDSRIELPEGLYIVVAGNRQQKVIVR